jgi:hypothetical protein
VRVIGFAHGRLSRRWRPCLGRVEAMLWGLAVACGCWDVSQIGASVFGGSGRCLLMRRCVFFLERTCPLTSLH